MNAYERVESNGREPEKHGLRPKLNGNEVRLGGAHGLRFNRPPIDALVALPDDAQERVDAHLTKLSVFAQKQGGIVLPGKEIHDAVDWLVATAQSSDLALNQYNRHQRISRCVGVSLNLAKRSRRPNTIAYTVDALAESGYLLEQNWTIVNDRTLWSMLLDSWKTRAQLGNSETAQNVRRLGQLTGAAWGVWNRYTEGVHALLDLHSGHANRPHVQQQIAGEIVRVVAPLGSFSRYDRPEQLMDLAKDEARNPTNRKETLIQALIAWGKSEQIDDEERLTLQTLPALATLRSLAVITGDFGLKKRTLAAMSELLLGRGDSGVAWTTAEWPDVYRMGLYAMEQAADGFGGAEALEALKQQMDAPWFRLDTERAAELRAFLREAVDNIADDPKNEWEQKPAQEIYAALDDVARSFASASDNQV